GLGMPALTTYFPGASFARNAIVGGQASSYPADNYYPSALSAVGFIDLAGRNYALAPATPYVRAGTAGKDVGVHFNARPAARAASTTPPPSPPPAPAPAPAPSPAPTPAPAPSSPAAGPSAMGAQNVTWTNLVNVTANGNSVTKTTGCD